MNGEWLFGENLASLVGIKAAYHAYTHSIFRNNLTEICLPGLNYTAQQMFWISAANNFCRKYLNDVDFLFPFDNHSPAKLLVNGIFSDMIEFSKDFNCKIRTKMNPENKCRVF